MNFSKRFLEFDLNDLVFFFHSCSLSDCFGLRCSDPDSAVPRCMLRLQEETAQVNTRSVCFKSVVHILTDEG